MIKKLPKKELYCYLIAITIALIGLVFLVIGIVGENSSVKSDLYLMVQGGIISWRYFGLIVIIIASIFAMCVMLYAAKKIDRVTERDLRRKQRLTNMVADNDNEIIVSDGKIVDQGNHNEYLEEKQSDLTAYKESIDKTKIDQQTTFDQKNAISDMLVKKEDSKNLDTLPSTSKNAKRNKRKNKNANNFNRKKNYNPTSKEVK